MDTRPYASRWRGAGGVRPPPPKPLRAGSIDVAGLRQSAHRRRILEQLAGLGLALAAILLLTAVTVGGVLFLGHSA